MARPKNDGKGRIGGRGKGTPNKVTSTARLWLSDLIDKNRRQIVKDLKELDPRSRLLILEKFMSYVLPKQQAVSAKIDFGALTDEQLDQIINRLTQGENEDTY